LPGIAFLGGGEFTGEARAAERGGDGKSPERTVLLVIAGVLWKGLK